MTGSVGVGGGETVDGGGQRLVIGDAVEWTSSTTSERHVGKVVAFGPGPKGVLVQPDHPNLRWSAWEDYADLKRPAASSPRGEEGQGT